MNNIYSCRKIEKLLHRDIHYIWLAGLILFFKVWNMTNNVAGIKALYEKQNSEMLALLKTIGFDYNKNFYISQNY